MFAELLAALMGAVPDGSLAVVGALARNAWAPPRATSDLDVAVAADAAGLVAIEAALASHGFAVARRQQVDPADAVPDIVVFRRTGALPRQVDVLVGKSAFEREALRRAVPVTVSGVEARVVTPEDLVVYKAIAGRTRDREDALAVARTQERAGRPLDWVYVEKWAAYWGVEARLKAWRADVGA